MERHEKLFQLLVLQALSGLCNSNNLSVNISETIVPDYTGNRRSNGGFSLNIFPLQSLHVKYILRIKSVNIKKDYIERSISCYYLCDFHIQS